MATILDPRRYWECPSCGHRHITHSSLRPGLASQPLHACPQHGGMAVPLVEAHPEKGLTQKVTHRIVERADYVGDEKGLRYVDGRPVMAVQTMRPDGSHDTHVYPGVATIQSKANTKKG